MSGSQGGKSGEGPSEQCRSFAPSLAAFVSGALPPEQEQAIAAHVATCGWCAARLAAYAEVDALLREAPAPEPPPSLRAGLYARIAAAEERQASARHSPSESETTVRRTRTHDTPAGPDVATIPTRHAPPSGAASRAARWIGTLAALLVVALLAGLFARQQQQQHVTTPSHHVHATATATAVPQRVCTPSEVQANLPAQRDLTSLVDLAMTGPSSGWAIGAIADSYIQPTTYHALLLRYSACRWEPTSDSLPDAQLSSIAMVSPDEGWAAGVQGNAPLLLHYQQGKWSKLTPPPTGDISSFTIVRALPTGEAWVVGRTPAGTSGYLGISLLHLFAGKWTRIDTPFEDVNDLAQAGPDDMWLLGTKHSSTGTELGHYQGGVLTKEVAQAAGEYLTDVHMLAPNDGWATGSSYVSGNETGANPTVNRLVALHYDGSTWTETNTGVAADAHSLMVLGQGEAWSYANATTVPQVITSTQREHSGQWQTVAWPYTDVITLAHFTCLTADDCWALGTYLLPDATRTIGNGQTVTVKGQTQVLLHYNNGAWHEYGHV